LTLKFKSDIIKSGGARMEKDISIYETAKNGGDYYLTYKLLNNQSDGELVKSLNSFTENVAEHLKKISNPEKNAEDINWNNVGEDDKKGLIAKWNKDAKRNNIFKEIAEGILIERGK
jgi:hypothetical protein